MLPFSCILIVIGIPQGVFANSVNRPKFCPFTSWNPIAATLANISMIGPLTYGLFVNSNDEVYIATRTLDHIQQRSGITSQLIRTIACTPCTDIFAIFVQSNGDIYLDNGIRGRVERWSTNATNRTAVMYVSATCYGLFVDKNGSVYCSVYSHHSVIRGSGSDNPNNTIMIAGTGTAGAASHLLNKPAGIFVDDNFNLFVADSENHRIQQFTFGSSNGITVAGNGLMGSLSLSYPMSVILDADGYLFIVDYGNHRIIGSGPHGYRCIAGCSGNSGARAHQLQQPSVMYFDSSGNLFVADWHNSRIQKFFLATNSCGEGIYMRISIDFSSNYVNLDVSYNRPQFTACADWETNATTFANSTALGSSPGPFGLFIDASNTIYAINRQLSVTRIWYQGTTSFTRTLSGPSGNRRSIFVEMNGNVYVDNASVGQVDKWSNNDTGSVIAIKFNASCLSVFMDPNNTLYCAMATKHQVAKQGNASNIYSAVVVAGNGTNGTEPNQLSGPSGIFIDTNFTLYVADTSNHRIQKFLYGEKNGTTVAGAGAPGTISLSLPHSIVLDGNGYMFIVEFGSHRIVASGPWGFRCVAACTGTSGSASNQLLSPVGIALNSYGSIFVIDRDNFRLQEFRLVTNGCNETLTTEQTSTVIVNTNGLTSMDTTSSEARTTTIPSMALSSSSSMISTTSLSTASAMIVYFAAFNPKECSNSSYMGTQCNISKSPCEVLRPCENDGTCLLTNTRSPGYLCLCPPNYIGTNCELDGRVCQANTCRNNGTCSITSNVTFTCTCSSGWRGVHCEYQINYCENVTCQNAGICRPLFQNYRCECLKGSYSGQHCEIVARQTQIYRIVSTSLAYIAIIAMCTVMLFVIAMDILKYWFHIDPAYQEMQFVLHHRRREHQKRLSPLIRINHPVNRSSL